MSRSYIQPGHVLNGLIAPAAGVTAGTGVVIANLFVIPQTTAAVGVAFDGYVTGVHSHAKIASQAWLVGDVVYWDDTNKWFTKTATAGFYGAGGVFTVVEAVGGTAGETTGKVRLSGAPVFTVSAAYVAR